MFQNLMLDLIEDNQALKNKEFTVSFHQLLLITFVTLRQRFSTFVLTCDESIPKIYAAKAMVEIGFAEEERNYSCNLQSLICQK